MLTQFFKAYLPRDVASRLGQSILTLTAGRKPSEARDQCVRVFSYRRVWFRYVWERKYYMKCCLTSTGIPIIKIRWYYARLIFLMGIAKLGRRLCIESALMFPRYIYSHQHPEIKFKSCIIIYRMFGYRLLVCLFTILSGGYHAVSTALMNMVSNRLLQ